MNEKPISFGKRDNSRMEKIRLSGTSHNMIAIKYKDKKGNVSQREVEPYKLEGNDLWAFDPLKDSIRRFKVKNLQSVRPLNKKYEPRWDIEMNYKEQIEKMAKDMSQEELVRQAIKIMNSSDMSERMSDEQYEAHKAMRNNNPARLKQIEADMLKDTNPYTKFGNPVDMKQKMKFGDVSEAWFGDDGSDNNPWAKHRNNDIVLGWQDERAHTKGAKGKNGHEYGMRHVMHNPVENKYYYAQFDNDVPEGYDLSKINFQKKIEEIDPRWINDFKSNGLLGGMPKKASEDNNEISKQKKDLETEEAKGNMAIGLGTLSGISGLQLAVGTAAEADRNVLTGTNEYWHNTSSDNVDSIKRSGLLKSKASNKDNLTNIVLGDRIKDGFINKDDIKDKVYMSKTKDNAIRAGVKRAQVRREPTDVFGRAGETLKIRLSDSDLSKLKQTDNPELMGAKNFDEFLAKTKNANIGTVKKTRPGLSEEMYDYIASSAIDNQRSALKNAYDFLDDSVTLTENVPSNFIKGGKGYRRNIAKKVLKNSVKNPMTVAKALGPGMLAASGLIGAGVAGTYYGVNKLNEIEKEKNAMNYNNEIEKLAQSRWRKHIDSMGSENDLYNAASEMGRNERLAISNPASLSNRERIGYDPKTIKQQLSRDVFKREAPQAPISELSPRQIGRRLSKLKLARDDRALARKRLPGEHNSPMGIETAFKDPEEYVDIIHGTNRAKAESFLRGGNGSTRLESEANVGGKLNNMGIQVHAKNRDRASDYAGRQAKAKGGDPAVLTGKIKRKYMYPNAYHSKMQNGKLVGQDEYGVPEELFNKIKGARVVNPNNGQVFVDNPDLSGRLPYGRSKTPGVPSIIERSAKSNAGRKDFVMQGEGTRTSPVRPQRQQKAVVPVGERGFVMQGEGTRTSPVRPQRQQQAVVPVRERGFDMVGEGTRTSPVRPQRQQQAVVPVGMQNSGSGTGFRAGATNGNTNSSFKVDMSDAIPKAKPKFKLGAKGKLGLGAAALAGAYGAKKMYDKKKEDNMIKQASEENYDVCCSCGRKRNEKIEPHCKDCGHDHTTSKKDYDKDVARNAKNVCEKCGYGWPDDNAPGCKKCGHDMSIAREKYKSV